MNETHCPPGRWEQEGKRRAAASEGFRWHAFRGRVAYMSGAATLASVRSNGASGADLRWLLLVNGWEWRISETPLAHHHAKTFLTRAGAMLEAEDIIAAARER